MAGFEGIFQKLIEVIQDSTSKQLEATAQTTQALRELTSKMDECNELIKRQSDFQDWWAHDASQTRKNVEWRQCNENPSLQDALRMLELQSSGQKWSNREAVLKEVARNLRVHKISCTGQLPVEADVQRGRHKATREVLLARGIIPSPDMEYYDAQWETGKTACYMPAFQAEMVRTGEITQEQIDEALNYEKFPGLREQIASAIEASLPINHVSGEPYQPDDLGWQLSMMAMLGRAQGRAVTEPASSYLMVQPIPSPEEVRDTLRSMSTDGTPESTPVAGSTNQVEP